MPRCRRNYRKAKSGMTKDQLVDVVSDLLESNDAVFIETFSEDDTYDASSLQLPDEIFQLPCRVYEGMAFTEPSLPCLAKGIYINCKFLFTERPLIELGFDNFHIVRP